MYRQLRYIVFGGSCVGHITITHSRCMHIPCLLPRWTRYIFHDSWWIQLTIFSHFWRTVIRLPLHCRCNPICASPISKEKMPKSEEFPRLATKIPLTPILEILLECVQHRVAAHTRNRWDARSLQGRGIRYVYWFIDSYISDVITITRLVVWWEV